MHIVLGDTTFTWTLTHVRRRSTKLKVCGPTVLEVVAPLAYPAEQAEAFIRAKADWVLNTAQKLATEASAVAKFSTKAGGIVPFMGQSYTLTVAYHPVRSSVRLDGSLLRVCLPPERQGSAISITHALITWYAEQAKQYLGKKTLEWSRIIGVKPLSVAIRDPKTRWGSCSSRGSINYSWRIMLAPPQVIDYLVVHELCHLLEPNHSSRFWQHVEFFLPDWQNNRRWLKLHGGVMMRLFSPE